MDHHANSPNRKSELLATLSEICTLCMILLRTELSYHIMVITCQLYENMPDSFANETCYKVSAYNVLMQQIPCF